MLEGTGKTTKIRRKVKKKILPEAGGPSFFARLVPKLKGILQKAKGKAQAAKQTVEARSGLKPLLALETRLTADKIKGLLGLMSDRFVTPALPDLSRKMVLEIGESLRFQPKILEKNPEIYSGLLVSAQEIRQTPGRKPFLIRGDFQTLPFESDTFDFVLTHLNSGHQGDVLTPIKEMGRVLAPGGNGMILDFHPYGLYAKSGSERLRSHQATIRGIEDYFKMCKVGGLKILDLHEGYLDNTLRGEFEEGEMMNAFRELKDSPMLLYLLVGKG